METILINKLNAAIQAMNAGNTNIAISNLNTFINLVNSQKNRAITPAQADALISGAQEVIQALLMVHILLAFLSGLEWCRLGRIC